MVLMQLNMCSLSISLQEVRLLQMHKNVEKYLKYVGNSFFDVERDVKKRVGRTTLGDIFSTCYQHGVGSACLPTFAFSTLSVRKKHTILNINISDVSCVLETNPSPMQRREPCSRCFLECVGIESICPTYDMHRKII